MKPIYARVLWILPAFAILATLTGCPWDPDKKVTPPIVVPEYLPQTTPANILANLEQAYKTQNFDEYEKLFSKDYIFVFNPADVGGQDPTPPQWQRADEVDAARNMFDDETVTSIELSWSPGDPESAADRFDAFPECLKVRVDNIELRVETRPPDLEEPLILKVTGASHIFYFKEGRAVDGEAYTYPDTGDKRWYCFMWEDSPIGT